MPNASNRLKYTRASQLGPKGAQRSPNAGIIPGAKAPRMVCERGRRPVDAQWTSSGRMVPKQVQSEVPVDAQWTLSERSVNALWTLSGRSVVALSGRSVDALWTLSGRSVDAQWTLMVDAQRMLRALYKDVLTRFGVGNVA